MWVHRFTLRNVSSQLIAAAVLSASLVLHSYERRPLDHDTEHWPQFVPTVGLWIVVLTTLVSGISQFPYN